MESAIAIVAEQQLIVVIACAANCAALAFDALPAVPFRRSEHIWSKLQTAWMSRATAVVACDQVFWVDVPIRISLFTGRAEVTVFADLQRWRDDGTFWSVLHIAYAAILTVDMDSVISEARSAAVLGAAQIADEWSIMGSARRGGSLIVG